MTVTAEKDIYLNQVLGGRYRIIERIGQGGMGDVYLAEHEILKKKVAIKILHLEQSVRKDAMERFRREAVAASNIGQDNIVDVTDFGYTEAGNAYFVMEYIDGVSLADVIRDEAPLPLYYVIAVASQICLALYSAHNKGIVHRDLKPENIIITKKENIHPFVKILDFGISKFIKPDNEADEKPLTKAGAIFGTPEYMSPEQAGGREITTKSDTYSVGVLMYELLTGRLPFNDDNYMKVLHAHQYEIPPFPSSLQEDIPADMDMIILKCLEKNPENRFDSMIELFSMLRRVYKVNNLDRFINLSVIFDSTTVKRTTVQFQNDFSDSEVLKILNKGAAANAEEKKKKSDKYSDEKKNSSPVFLLLLISLLSLAVSAYFVFFYKTDGVVQKEIRYIEKEVPLPDADALKDSSKTDKKEVKETKKKNNSQAAKKKKTNGAAEKESVKVSFSSTTEGVRVFEKETNKFICETPCEAKFNREESGVMVLGFKKPGYRIDSMIIRLDRDTRVNVELNTTK